MTTRTTTITMFSLVICLLLVSAIAIEDLVCMKNHTFMETSGDAVLSVFIDTDYGPECNITSPRSIQEVATALYVAQQLNRADYVPGVSLGLRIYDTCNDRIAVYKQALVSAVEMDCSAHYDLGLLVPARYGEVLEPLRSLDLLPVNTYSPPNLTLPMLDVLVDFLAGRYSQVDLLLADSRPVLDAFLRKSREAGICVKSDKGGLTEAEVQADKSVNPTTTTTTAEQQQLVVVALGDYEDVTTWLEKGEFGNEDNDDEDKKIWIVMTLDNSHVDDHVPEGSYLIKPEHFVVDLGPDGELDNGNGDSDDDIPASAIARSPHVLSVGKAILEIAKGLRELQQTSCPYSSSGGNDGGSGGGGGGTSCALPRFEPELRKPMSNSEVYETLKVPAKSHSTRYVVSRKIDGSLSETTAYQIDSTSARYRVVAEKEQPRLSRLCVRNYTRRCQQSCANFKLLELEAEHEQDEDDDDDDDEARHRVLKSQVWVPILLTITSCASFACCAILAFVVYRYFVEDILDGNPLLTCLLIGATLLMLQSALPFCLEDRAMGAEHLNSRKILVSGLGFGLAFSVMLTRALFLAFSSKGVFSTQHINGYLQCLMLLFMAGVELAIAVMYFALSDADSARVARSPVYIALLGYDIFLLCSLFASCFFVSHVQRNYREGTCFFATGIGLLVCWAVWITCFLLMGQDKRDAIVCSGIVATACLIICGVLVPRTYFMCSHYVRDKSYVHAAASAMAASRFAGPPPPLGDHLLMDDPRFVNAPVAARQGAYLDVGINGRQPFYEYVSATGSPAAQQHQQQQQALAAGSNYYYGGGNEMVTRPTTSAAAAAAAALGAVPSHLMTGTTTTTGAGTAAVQGKNRGIGGGMLSRLSFRRGRSPEPRRTPGYSNYGFRPEMRELDVAANVAAQQQQQQPQPYVVPRLYVDEPDVSRIQPEAPQQQAAARAATAASTKKGGPFSKAGVVLSEARYALPRSLLRKKVNKNSSGASGGAGAAALDPSSTTRQQHQQPIEPEVFVKEHRSIFNEPYQARRSPSPRPGSALALRDDTIEEEHETQSLRSARVTRF